MQQLPLASAATKSRAPSSQPVLSLHAHKRTLIVSWGLACTRRLQAVQLPASKNQSNNRSPARQSGQQKKRKRKKREKDEQRQQQRETNEAGSMSQGDCASCVALPCTSLAVPAADRGSESAEAAAAASRGRGSEQWSMKVTRRRGSAEGTRRIRSWDGGRREGHTSSLQLHTRSLNVLAASCSHLAEHTRLTQLQHGLDCRCIGSKANRCCSCFHSCLKLSNRCTASELHPHSAGQLPLSSAFLRSDLHAQSLHRDGRLHLPLRHLS